MHLRRLFTAATASAAALAATIGLAGCADGAGNQPGASEGGAGSNVTLTLRLWDENVAKAYDTSLEKFTAANPNIKVNVNVVPWDNYFSTLRNEVGAGGGDDVFWLNGATITDYITAGSILDITATLGADAQQAWLPAVVDQYTFDGKLYGVPQITDGGSALYVNTELLDAAGVTPEQLSNAKWSLDPAEDTLLPLLQKLTVDENGRNAADPAFDPNRVKTYGFNAANELQNILLNFIGENGGTYQDAEGKMTFTNPKTVEAMQYLVDLVNKYHVAPPAEATNASGDYTREEFVKGNIAVLESGTYNLTNVQQAKFKWAITEIPAGPTGKATAAPGVVMAANKNTRHPEEQKKLLEWLGSAEGTQAIGESGVAIPAVVAARDAYDQYWKDQGVDTSAFFSVLEGATLVPPVIGSKFNQQYEAFNPILGEVFAAKVPVAEGLQKAQDAADAAS